MTKTMLSSAVSVAVLIGLEAKKINSTDVGTLEHGKQALFLTQAKIEPADMPELLATLDGRKNEIFGEDGPYTEQAVQAIDKIIFGIGIQVRGYNDVLKRFDSIDTELDLNLAGGMLADKTRGAGPLQDRQVHLANKV